MDWNLIIVLYRRQAVDWNLIIVLYRRNAGGLSATPGVYFMPMLKREHVFLTSFSKM